MSKIKKWTIINSRLVLNHKWCQVRRDRVKLPNKQIIDDFFINIRPDIALVLPVTTNQEIVFVRQYRHGVREILLELPAGSFNPDFENALTAAKRELREETGYCAGEITKLMTLYDNPVKDTNKIHLFLAQNVRQVDSQQLDETEDITVVLIPLKKVKEKILQGEICVCGSITAIFLGLNFLNVSS